jgi:tripartite-type tricarboxylate transporter receptor subunit TctC
MRWIGALGTVVALACQAAALGADPPFDRQLRIVVPLAAGSSIDARARIIAHALGERIGTQPMVDNRPGAGGTLGSAYVAKGSSDGATVLFTNDSIVINPHVYRDPGYDALNDLAPLTQAYVSAMVLVTYPGVKAPSVKELIALAQRQPDAMSYGSSGNGGLPHLAMEAFQRASAIRFTHVPYKGDAQALTDVIAGRVQVMVSGIPAALPHIKSGSLRALAVTTARRIRALPDVPTMAEAGVTGYQMYAWTGFFAPAKTPAATRERLARELAAAMQSSEVKANLEATGGEVFTSSPTVFAQFVRAEYERYGKLVKTLGLRPD